MTNREEKEEDMGRERNKRAKEEERSSRDKTEQE